MAGKKSCDCHIMNYYFKKVCLPQILGGIDLKGFILRRCLTLTVNVLYFFSDISDTWTNPNLTLKKIKSAFNYL